MIRVIVERKQELIKKLTITGHANAAPHGEDLVCAGVSAIGVGLLNALDLLAKDSCHMIMSEGDIRIDVVTANDTNQMILNVGIIQLESIEEVYKKFIRIKKQEV